MLSCAVRLGGSTSFKVIPEMCIPVDATSFVSSAAVEVSSRSELECVGSSLLHPPASLKFRFEC